MSQNMRDRFPDVFFLGQPLTVEEGNDFTYVNFTPNAGASF